VDNILVSIIILNWNGFESTKLCLESLKDLSYPNIEIILVDNGSHDGSKTKLPKLLRKLKVPTQFINLPSNTGFTGGHIAGFEKAQGEILFLLNNDSVADPQIINNALNIFKSDDKIGAVGGRAFFWNDANPIFNDKNQYYSFQTINPFTAEVTTLEYGLKQCQPNNVSGSAVFVKREAVDKVGYLDNRFFAYYEESDLFARMKRAGYKVIYSPDIKIWHKVGESTRDKQGFYYYLIFRNQFMYAYKNFDKQYLLVFLRYYFYTFFLKALLYSLLSRGQDKLMNRARLKSFAWNALHILPTIRARRLLQKRYGQGYSELMIAENFQPVSILLDATDASKKSVEKTLESINRQSVLPAEVIIVTKKEMAGTEEFGLNIRQVVDAGLFVTEPWNLAFICSNEEWLLLLEAGDTLDEDFVKSSYLTALRTKANIVYPTEVNKHPTPAKFQINGFKKRNTIGQSLLVSRHAMRSVGGLANGDIYHSTWKLVADTIMLTHTKIVRSAAKILSGQQADNTDSRSSLDYPEFNQVSAFRYWVWTSPQPIGRLLRVLKSIFLSSKLATLLKVLSANIKVQNNRSGGPISLIRVVGQLIFLRTKSVKSSLIYNYDLYKQRRLIKNTQDIIADFSVEDLPVFINCRDRVTDLKKLVAWLKGVGVKKIALVDNDSTYPQLLEFYQASGCQVLPLGFNHGHKAPWESMAVGILAKDSFYVVTDPDIIPDKSCPRDALDYFHDILQKYKEFMKVGFSLKIDDLPDHYQLKKTVINWESQFWKKELEPNLYIADIDTTFALYRPNTWYFLENSLRTGYPYMARHTAWYQDNKCPSAEDQYYQLHASRAVNTWNMEDIPEHFKAAIAATAA